MCWGSLQLQHSDPQLNVNMGQGCKVCAGGVDAMAMSLLTSSLLPTPLLGPYPSLDHPVIMMLIHSSKILQLHLAWLRCYIIYKICSQIYGQKDKNNTPKTTCGACCGSNLGLRFTMTTNTHRLTRWNSNSQCNVMAAGNNVVLNNYFCLSSYI